MITSRANPTIKALRALQRRTERESKQRGLVAGSRPVAEAVQLAAPIELLVTAPELLSSPFAQQLVAEFRRNGGSVLDVSADVFTSLAEREHPQGLIAVVQPRLTSLAEIVLQPDSLWLVLNDVADPGNLGTIMRSADAVGVPGIILLGDSTDPFDPAALRAAMGALFNLQIVRCSWPELRSWQQQHGLRLIGTSDQAAVDYRQLPPARPLLLMMGRP